MRTRRIILGVVGTAALLVAAASASQAQEINKPRKGRPWDINYASITPPRGTDSQPGLAGTQDPGASAPPTTGGVVQRWERGAAVLQPTLPVAAPVTGTPAAVLRLLLSFPWR